MDQTTRNLVSYTMSADSLLSEAALGRTTELLFDSIACAVVGAGSEAVALTAKVARRVQSDPGATVIGYGFKTSPELAALVNSMMVRAYDYNDALLGHPSDMIGGVLAAGEIAHASGKDVLQAIGLAYEIYGAFERSVPPRMKTGFDQGTFMNVGVAMAAGRLWGMTEEQLANAASLSLIPNIPLGVSRWGDLSMMKGCATAFSVRNGVFAAMLAKEGFTSAPEPFSGIYGLHYMTKPFETRLPLDQSGQQRVVEMTYVKPLPAENNTIGVLEMAPRIRAWAPVDQIESIDIELATGYEIHLADEPKYDPKTRETADHSFPYMLARALVDGELTLESYTPERIADPSIRPLMRRIKVHANAEMRKIMQESKGCEPKPARIRIRSKDGREMTEDLMGHSGHPDRPQSTRREAIDRKLDICSKAIGLQPDHREKIRETWWNVAKAADIGEPLKTLAGIRSL